MPETKEKTEKERKTKQQIREELIKEYEKLGWEKFLDEIVGMMYEVQEELEDYRMGRK
ncbi:MAG: hypothetical protein GXP44_02350 [bacterium]|nr:hypothetical protein [bacterium]